MSSSFDMWTHILGINLTGTFLCTKFALPLMADYRAAAEA